MPAAPAAKYLPGLGLGVATLIVLGLGCSGRAFKSGDAPCQGDGCGAESGAGNASSGAGGKSSGGAGSAGAGEGGSTSAGGGLGPVAGAGPLGGSGGTLGSAGALGVSGGGNGNSASFPATPVLDDFDREGPEPGLSWLGAADAFSIVEKALWCGSCGAAALWEKSFGPEQEVHATLRAFDNDASEINLVLKGQNDPNCELVEVLYSPASNTVRIAYCTDQGWTDLPEQKLTLEAGDRFGGRALADGQIEVYVNEQLVATFDASGFPHASGRIGVNGVSAESGLSWDDFGGGDWR